MKALAQTTRRFAINFITTVIAIAGMSFAQAEDLAGGEWHGKSHATAGSWKIVEDGGRSFLEIKNLKTKSGPDLKIFLSPKSIYKVTGANATEGSLKVAKLPSNKGTHRIALPKGANLSKYESILIHCEKYSKLWAAGKL